MDGKPLANGRQPLQVFFFPSKKRLFEKNKPKPLANGRQPLQGFLFPSKKQLFGKNKPKPLANGRQPLQGFFPSKKRLFGKNKPKPLANGRQPLQVFFRQKNNFLAKTNFGTEQGGGPNFASLGTARRRASNLSQTPDHSRPGKNKCVSRPSLQINPQTNFCTIWPYSSPE